MEPLRKLSDRLRELHNQRLAVGCRSAEGRRITDQITALLRGDRIDREPFDAKQAQTGERE